MKQSRDQKTRTRGQDARATAGETPALPQPAIPQPTLHPQRFQPKYGEVTIRDRGRLPHWEAEGATYFVTFRLSDSLPQSVLDAYRFERRDLLLTAERQGRQLSATELKRLDELFSERVEAYLDSGYWGCHLAQPQMADMVAGALQFFDGQRYRQFAWSVMPNHVHTVFRSLPNWTLEKILYSWKSFTAKEANKLLKRTGDFWQPEYFDHLIRNEEEFYRYIEYVASNPQKAGLIDWKWVWVRPR
jgi:REP element-mobilizing transposase RayT